MASGRFAVEPTSSRSAISNAKPNRFRIREIALCLRLQTRRTIRTFLHQPATCTKWLNRLLGESIESITFCFCVVCAISEVTNPFSWRILINCRLVLRAPFLGKDSPFVPIIRKKVFERKSFYFGCQRMTDLQPSHAKNPLKCDCLSSIALKIIICYSVASRGSGTLRVALNGVYSRSRAKRAIVLAN